MKKVAIYTASAVDLKHIIMLEAFKQGVLNSGDMPFINNGYFHPCGEDVNVFFGSWKDRADKHHRVKQELVKCNKPFIVIETPLIGRGPVSNVLQDDWYRIGLNGFLADTGNFNNKAKPSDRWEKISKELNVELKPWKTRGEYIVVALQLPGDASLRGRNISEWAYDIIRRIRELSSRKIILRTPQLDRDFDTEYINRAVALGNVEVQRGTKENLNSTIDGALFTVSYSSGFGIESVIRGVPVVVCDIGSFALPMSTPLEEIFTSPRTPDRQQWLNNLSYAQWSISEIESGEAWKHLREIL